MDGMAKRERTTAGDELSEKLGGIGSPRSDRAAGDKATIYVPASTIERMPTAINGDMPFGGVGRDRNPTGAWRDVGIVARDAG